MATGEERLMRDAVLEIGVEELPARFMRQALADAREYITEALASARLESSEVRVYGTPRRIIVQLCQVASTQNDLTREVRGPAARAAFDSEGRPTKAALGFARSAGVLVESLVSRPTPQGDYVYATVTEGGRPANVVLAEVFPQMIVALSFPKSMRWGSHDFRFARPIRWILALLGTEVIAFDTHAVSSGRMTWGHRTLAPGAYEIESAEEYLPRLHELGVMADPEERAESIRRQADGLASSIGGQAVIDPELLEEVTFLVEWPRAFVGRFAEDYLDLPQACVITPMKDHQRYFPVRDAQGDLMPAFIGVRNGGDHAIDVVRAGNERVLAARLADARFFYEEDMKRSMAERVDDLSGVVFQERLGTMYDKSVRIGRLASELLCGAPEAALAERTAFLAKADLVTSVVREFTELQGVMGREYALRQGEDRIVADAVFEHYLPRFAGDILPASLLGAALSVADKIDTLVGYFCIGLIPSGSADPYALRRQAAGAVSVHAEWRFQLGLDSLVVRATNLLAQAGVAGDAAHQAQVVEDVMGFIRARLKVSLEEAGFRHDIAEAVLAAGFGRPACLFERAQAVAQVVDEGWFVALATAGSRVRNIAMHAATDAFSQALFEDDAEHELFGAAKAVEAEVRASIESRMSGFVDKASYVSALERMSVISPVIDRYFEKVMVMVDDESVRNNRLAMLKWVSGVLSMVIDLSNIVFVGG
ncbi:MAG TPA: glycine--tRNA ligase subunit beta [Bacillota bacterium]|nr:glycine--tRNA ligase subunit beta [Bacillota bacterium]